MEKFDPIEDNLFWHQRDELVIAFHKLRHNLDFKMMEFVFEVNQKPLSQVFKEVVDKLYRVFKKIVIWRISHKSSKSYRTILDFTSTHQLTFSPNKDHPTFKLLVGCDEMGAINFISQVFVGSMSDREIMIKSGFLDIITKGDAVLAEGFDVLDLLEEKGALVNTPPFLQGKEQLNDYEGRKTRVIANRRSVIEQIHCRARKNKILTTPLSKPLWPIADKIIYICFALTDFCKPIVNCN